MDDKPGACQKLYINGQTAAGAILHAREHNGIQEIRSTPRTFALV
jgi:hypothetical protein